MPAKPAQLGVTLVETLAVIVLLGAMASLVLIGLNRNDDETRLLLAEARMRHLDRSARMFARTEAGVFIRPVSVGLDAARFEVASESRQSDAPRVVVLASDSLPVGVVVDLTPSDKMHTLSRAILFDRSGRTGDYSILLRTEAVTRRLSVSGPTGWMEVGP